jgi:hypothetical protein
MAGAKHPLIATHGPNASPNLISQGLESESAISCGERARKAVTQPCMGLRGEKDADCFLISPAEQLFEPVEWDKRTIVVKLEALRQMKAVNCVEEE